MRLVTFSSHDDPSQRRLGLLTAGGVIDVELVSGGAGPGSMLDLLVAGPNALAAVRGLDGAPALPLDMVRLQAPLPNPLQFRDFMAFERHVQNARARRGRDVPPEWYQAPVFYFSNNNSIRGPEDRVWAPPGCEALDLECEVGVVIGLDGSDIPVERAFDHVAGLCLLNDWSARDLQVAEMAVGLGPAKAKDFATSIGPWLVTFDELKERVEGMHVHLEVTARVNGQELTRGNLDQIHFSIPELIAHASRGVRLRAGELIGTGTFGGGSLLEHADAGWLQAGDVIELEADVLGVLRTEVVSAPA